MLVLLCVCWLAIYLLLSLIGLFCLVCISSMIWYWFACSLLVPAIHCPSSFIACACHSCGNVSSFVFSIPAWCFQLILADVPRWFCHWALFPGFVLVLIRGCIIEVSLWGSRFGCCANVLTLHCVRGILVAECASQLRLHITLGNLNLPFFFCHACLRYCIHFVSCYYGSCHV